MVPAGFKVLFGKDSGRGTKIWCLVNPKARKVKVAFRIIKTGEPVPTGLKYVGSFDSSPTRHIFVGKAKRGETVNGED